MPRFLAIDWDHHQLHVVAAAVGRGTLRIERAAFVQETRSPNPAEAEALGKVLRERLKQAGIAPAPVLACIGRERVIVKEVRYPAVAPSEEAAVVHFQVVKELSYPAEEVVIDYAPLDGDEPGGERRALAFVARCEMVAAYRTLCASAGLRLQALTPRPFGTIASTRAGSAPLGHTRAVLTLAPRWSELCVASGERLVLAQTLGDKLVEEVRRNLAVFNSNSPNQTVRELCLLDGGNVELRERLHEALKLPVHAVDAFAGSEPPACEPAQLAGFAGAVGLLREQSSGRLPVNFASPKQVASARDPNALRVALLAALAAALVLAATVYGYAQSANKERTLTAERLLKVSLDGQLAQWEEDAKRIRALQEWTSGDINLLDELYDLTDRFPPTETMRITHLSVMPIVRIEKDKEKHVARIGLNGVVTDDIHQVDQFLERMDADGHYRVDPKQVSANSDQDRGKFSQKFMAQADIAPRRPALYARRLPASLATAPTAPAAVPPPPVAVAPAAVASQPAPASDVPAAPPGAQPPPAVSPQPTLAPAPDGSPFRRPRGEKKQGVPK